MHSACMPGGRRAKPSPASIHSRRIRLRAGRARTTAVRPRSRPTPSPTIATRARRRRSSARSRRAGSGCSYAARRTRSSTRWQATTGSAGPSASPPRRASGSSRPRPLALLIAGPGGRVIPGVLGEDALAGHVVDLEPDPARIEKGQRVVARRPRALVGGPDHSGADPPQKQVPVLAGLATGPTAAVLVKTG